MATLIQNLCVAVADDVCQQTFRVFLCVCMCVSLCIILCPLSKYWGFSQVHERSVGECSSLRSLRRGVVNWSVDSIRADHIRSINDRSSCCRHEWKQTFRPSAMFHLHCTWCPAAPSVPTARSALWECGAINWMVYICIYSYSRHTTNESSSSKNRKSVCGSRCWCLAGRHK